MQLVECVPNFSEGNDKMKVGEILSSISSVSGVRVLNYSSDCDHNRSVISFIGDPDSVLEAAYLGVLKASELIDINVHKGEHPRIGATDVIPLIPLKGISMDECIVLSRKLGAMISAELGIPVYLYGESAVSDFRRNLANIRRGGYERIREEIQSNPDFFPDFGDKMFHPTAGATVVGAREILIAYNVYLDTTDLSIARSIAESVRNSSGGFRDVKALGVSIRSRGRVQVSMNITNHRSTPLYRVFEFIKMEARRWGVRVISSEIIGLSPLKALLASAEYYLQLADFSETQILDLFVDSEGLID